MTGITIIFQLRFTLLLISYLCLAHLIYCIDVEWISKFDFNLENNDLNLNRRKLIIKHHNIIPANINEYVRNWTKLSHENHDPNRLNRLIQATQSVAGIYQNKTKVKLLGLENHILVNVISYHSNSSSLQYLLMLQNWICYANHYNFIPLTFLVPIPHKTFNEQIIELNNIGITGIFIEYPTELFWKLLTKKQNNITNGFASADYQGNLPSFYHFGALVMLIPILEVLELGYNVIYLDLDIAFINDPIPALIHGSADVSITIELRSCYSPSASIEYALRTHWTELEPNTGIMHLLSKESTISFFYRWLSRIINDNVNNDQKVLQLKDFGGKLDFSCNKYLNQYSNILKQYYDRELLKKGHRFITDELFYNKTNINNITYCYLNEYEFQNGKTSFHCAKNRQGSSAEYILAMKEQKFKNNDESITQTIPKKIEKQPIMSPIAIHANHCDNKIHEFMLLGLWLTNQSQIESKHSYSQQRLSCNTYDYKQTLYGKTNWTRSINNAINEMISIKNLLKNGTIIKFHRKREIYLILNNELRQFPDTITFDKMGYQSKDIQKPGPYNLFNSFPIPMGDYLDKIE